MADVVVCSNCGFHYSTYKDDEYAAVSAHSEQKTLDEKTVRYIQQKLESNPFRFDKHEATVLKFSTPAKHSLLDIGFGGAVFLQKMKTAGFDCYGIELDKQYMLYAKEVLQLSNVYSLPVQDNFWQQNHQSFFDVIVLWDVLEHVNDPVQFIQSIATLLKPGGQLFIDTPCRDTFYHQSGEWIFKFSFGYFKGLLHDMYSSHRFGHKQILSKGDMHKLMQTNSLEIQSLEVLHEMSFPYQFYLKKILKSDILVKLALPFVQFFFKIFKIRNKMMVVAERKNP